jgi:uncharacterized membrane protein YfcA
MILEPGAIAVALILFVATLIRSALGFGEALVAVPLLAFVVPVEVAAPVAVLVSITVAIIVMLQDWKQVHVGGAVRLVLPTFVGIPIGLTLLSASPEPAVIGVLAVVIIAFSGHSLLRGKTRVLKNDNFAWLFGFVAGILGGAYGMNGPPLVAYGSLRRWSPQQFRATLQAYFLPAGLAGLSGYWMVGLWTTEVSRMYLLSLPFVLLATFLGSALNRRMAAHRFLVYVHAGLIAIGIALLTRAVI